MSEQTAVAKTNELTEVQRLGKLLAASGYFADTQEMAQAAVKILAGKEIGVPPIASMMGVNIIKGKVTLGGNLIASRIRFHGYDYRVTKQGNTGCEITFFSKAVDGKREELGRSSFTEADAKAAGVFSQMYQKYPRNMYFNRAISNGAKWHVPDVFGGLPVYVPEELGANVDGEGNVEPGEPEQTKAEVVEDKMVIARPAPVEGGDKGALVTAEQVKRFWAIAGSNNWTQDGVKELLESLGYTTSKALTVRRYDELCAYLQSESEQQWRDSRGMPTPLSPDDYYQPLELVASDAKAVGANVGMKK